MDKKFLRKSRNIKLRCTNEYCKHCFIIQISNIYNTEINDIINCPMCGTKKPTILEITMPKKQKQNA